jgi:hypothetical protein
MKYAFESDEFFLLAKFSDYISLSLLVSCSTSLHVVYLKIYLTSTLKLPQQNFQLIFIEVIKHVL